MPNGALRILATAAVALFVLSGAGQTHDNGKPAPQTTTTPATDRGSGAKFVPVSKDVCAKHPNLKQCS